VTPTSGYKLITGVRQVGDESPIGVVDHGPCGNENEPVITARPMSALALAVTSTLTFDVRVVPELEQSSDGMVGPHDHAPAVAAIATVGSALGLERFVVKCGRAVAARPRAHVDFDLIHESHDYLPIKKGTHQGSPLTLVRSAAIRRRR
jgi:hypothetical protein